MLPDEESYEFNQVERRSKIHKKIEYAKQYKSIQDSKFASSFKTIDNNSQERSIMPANI